MIGRFLPHNGLRSRMVFLSAAPSLLCLLAMAAVVAWFVRGLQLDMEARALQAAGTRFETRMAELRGRLDALSLLLPRHEALSGALPAESGAGRLRPLLAELQAADPSIQAIELRVPGGGRPDRVYRLADGCASLPTARCEVGGPPLAESVAALDLPDGTRAEVRISAFMSQELAEALAFGEKGALMLLTEGAVGVSTLPVPTSPLADWAPNWLLDAMAANRVGTGSLSLDERVWQARVAPLEGGAVRDPSRPRSFILLLLPAGAGAEALDRTVGAIVAALAAMLAVGIALAAIAAGRLGNMLSALTDALRRLGRGDLSVSIPALPPGAPRELVELTDACTLFRDASAERSRLSERLRWLANFDALTGLPNRALLGDRLDLAFATARRDGTGLVVLALDLDHFKEVNDTLGHAMGDEVLRVVASRLRSCLRTTDTLARTGGDEFVLVAPGLEEPAQLEGFANRLLAAMEDPVPIGSEYRSIGLSIGAAVLAPGGFDGKPEAMLQDADLALYQAKAEGGSCLRIFEPAMNDRLRTRRALVADLRVAMARQELTILFQPQVSTATRRIKGAEALLRWHHPTRGVIGPDVFIPLAEETGLIVPIGAWVLEEACHVARRWGGLSLAVNVSAHQVRQASFVDTVERALARSGLPARCLELEITEAAMLANSAETLGILSRLRSLGVRLAMDDFGTGYSSLATLQRFRFDKIKVDRSFVRHLVHDARAVALLRAVIALGSALDVTTNAEGVEDEGQLSLLQAEGCDEAQGYLFGRPMSAADFEAQLGTRNSSAA
ncbi:putative bifunctional diguanylate cyclase/phosphodiesterase [Muricoccus pecuniae]|uniref:Diguanylate cyclase (GGDEF)-like protein n=1 Tax=Muricoccus pecuniae TaxID=693023 RepID=A0A840Y1A2_9PROT|nr:EAL domain-containing protein [Roseomonas pecuniae]MBB5693370.1 diguanylate cyclase (GGDEF)-like protein [Roseomonas pecuniae]